MSKTWLENTHVPPANASLQHEVSSEFSETQYSVLRVPSTSPSLDKLVSKFRDTKLAALRTDPASFVQRHDLEAEQPVSVWKGRLTHQITVLVCIAHDGETLTVEDALLQKDWLGFAAVHGPITSNDYYAFPAMGQIISRDTECESRWQLSDLYTFPAHRGQGIAKILGEGLFRVVAEDTLALGNGRLKRARMRLVVHPKSTWLVDGYTRLGFSPSGTVTLKEGMTINGMKDSIPADTDSTEELRALWETRFGITMEKVVNVG